MKGWNELMMIRCTNGDLLNPQKMELFTIIEDNGSFHVAGICRGNRYDLIYTNNRPEAEAILDDLFRTISVGFQRAESIDYIDYIRNRRGRGRQ